MTSVKRVTTRSKNRRFRPYYRDKSSSDESFSTQHQIIENSRCEESDLIDDPDLTSELKNLHLDIQDLDLSLDIGDPLDWTGKFSYRCPTPSDEEVSENGEIVAYVNNKPVLNFGLPTIEPLNFEVNHRRYSLSLQRPSESSTPSVQNRTRSFSLGDRVNKAIHSLNEVQSRGLNNLNSSPNSLEGKMEAKPILNDHALLPHVVVDNISPISNESLPQLNGFLSKVNGIVPNKVILESVYENGVDECTCGANDENSRKRECDCLAKIATVYFSNIDDANGFAEILDFHKDHFPKGCEICWFRGKQVLLTPETMQLIARHEGMQDLKAVLFSSMLNVLGQSYMFPIRRFIQSIDSVEDDKITDHLDAEITKIVPVELVDKVLEEIKKNWEKEVESGTSASQDTEYPKSSHVADSQEESVSQQNKIKEPEGSNSLKTSVVQAVSSVILRNTANQSDSRAELPGVCQLCKQYHNVNTPCPPSIPIGLVKNNTQNNTSTSSVPSISSAGIFSNPPGFPQNGSLSLGSQTFVNPPSSADLVTNFPRHQANGASGMTLGGFTNSPMYQANNSSGFINPLMYQPNGLGRFTNLPIYQPSGSGGFTNPQMYQPNGSLGMTSGGFTNTPIYQPNGSFGVFTNPPRFQSSVTSRTNIGTIPNPYGSQLGANTLTTVGANLSTSSVSGINQNTSSVSGANLNTSSVYGVNQNTSSVSGVNQNTSSVSGVNQNTLSVSGFQHNTSSGANQGSNSNPNLELVFQNMEALVKLCTIASLDSHRSADSVTRYRMDISGKLDQFLVFMTSVDLITQIAVENRKTTIISHLEAFIRSLDDKATVLRNQMTVESNTRCIPGGASNSVFDGSNYLKVAKEIYSEVREDLNDSISQWEHKSRHDFQSDFSTTAPELERKLKRLSDLCEKIANWVASSNRSDKEDIKKFLNDVSELQISYEKWRRDLRQIITAAELDRKRDGSGLVPQIEIKPFTGYSGNQSIYEFLIKFEEVYANLIPNSLERATLLFEKCLSDELKIEFQSVSRDYQSLVAELRKNYGNAEKILAYQLSSLNDIKPKGDSMQHTVSFLKQVYSKTQQILNVVKSSGENNNLHAEFYQRRTVNELSKPLRRLRGGLFDKFQRQLSDGLASAQEAELSYNWENGVNLFLTQLRKEWTYLETSIDSRNNGQIVESNKFNEKINYGDSDTKTDKRLRDIVKQLGKAKDANALMSIQKRVVNDPVLKPCIGSNSGNGANTSKLNTNNQDNGGKGGSSKSNYKNFDGKCIVRCFICPVEEKPHELGVCALGMSAGNTKRRDKALKIKLCLSCLRQDCLAQRIGSTNDKQKYTCLNRSMWISCTTCVEEGKTYKNNKFKNCPTNVLVCSRHNLEDEEAVIQDLKQKLSFDETITPVFTVSSLSHQLDTVNKSKCTVPDRIKGHIERDPEVAYDTSTGELVPLTNDLVVVEESKENSLYFLQFIRIGQAWVLSFYDCGATGGVILGSIAKDQGLKLADKRSQFIVGAGGHVTATGYGRYRLILGPGPDGEYYELTCTGMHQITSAMARYEFQDINKEVKHYDESNQHMLRGRPLPQGVGGCAAGLIIGIKTTLLMPKIIMILPNGFMVAESKLTDVYGSNIIYGGPHEVITQMDKISGVMTSDTQRLSFYFSEMYIQYRDSVRQDAVFISNWEKECSDLPILIEEEESEFQKGIVDNDFMFTDSDSLDKFVEAFEENYLCDEDKSSDKKGDFNVIFDSPQKEDIYFKKQWDESKQFKSEIELDSCLGIDSNQVKPEDQGSDQFEVLTNTFGQNMFHVNKLITEPILVCDQVKPEDIMQDEVETNIEDTNRIQLGAEPKFEENVKFQLGAETIHTCLSCSCISSVQTKDESFKSAPDIEKLRLYKLKKLVREWEDYEQTGTLLDYRCPVCQRCEQCKISGRIRNRSVREEDEQHVIDQSIRIDWTEKRTYVKLPFIKNPLDLRKRWGARSNFYQASKLIKVQLTKPKEDKESVCRFWNEIKTKGFVKRLADLPAHIQEKIKNSDVLHFFPWRMVFHPSSVTTPCRLVVDPTMSGLNEFLAKGVNTLHSLQALFLNFRSWEWCGSYDISKMYNNLFLEEDHFQYQLILWIDDLNPDNPIEIYVLVRAMYGVTPSGNQAETTIRKAAFAMKDTHPDGAKSILLWTYVDDGLPGAPSRALLEKTLKEVGEILDAIGFCLKCFTFCHQTEISEKASADGKSVGVCGMRWFPATDEIALADGQINFNPNVRGKKKDNPHPVKSSKDLDDSIVPSSFQRREAQGKVAEIYDITGMVEPLKMGFKIKTRELISKDLGWKDVVPEDQRPEWLKIFGQIQDSRLLRWKRAVVPKDAISPTKIRLIECHDGSQHGSATGVYAGFELKNGQFSSQLIFGRSALAEPKQSVPRNELMSSVLGCYATYVLKNSLGDRISEIISVGDSRVSLCWEVNPDARLRQWVFTRVRQISRLTGDVPRFWVAGEFNPADKATKGGMTVEDCAPGSVWINGYEWMTLSTSSMRSEGHLQTYEDIYPKLTKEQKEEVSKELLPSIENNLNIKVTTRGCYNFETSNQVCTEFIGLYDDPDIQEVIRRTRRGPHILEVNTDVITLIPTIKKWRNLTGSNNLCSKFGLMNFKYGIRKVQFADIEVQSSDQILTFNKSELNVSNLSLGEGSIVMATVSKNSTIQLEIDVVYYGLPKTINRLAICFKFSNMAIHATHSRKVEKSICTSREIRRRNRIRSQLEKRCRLCHPFSKKAVNLGFLDRLYNFVPESDYFQQDNRELLRKTVIKVPVSTLKQTTRKQIRGKFEKDVKEAMKREKIRDTSEEDNYEIVQVDDLEKSLAWTYLMRQGSKEVTESLPKSKLKEFKYDSDLKIWFYGGRLMERDKIEFRDCDTEVFFDSPSISYVTPVLLGSSPISYALVMSLHWNVMPHRGSNTQSRTLAQIAHITQGRRLIDYLRRDCKRCRILCARTLSQEMAGLAPERLMVCPPFYAIQTDVMSPFRAYSMHNQRAEISIFALVIICVVTGAVAIYALEHEDTDSIVKAILRHSFRFGFPKINFCDLGASLVKAGSVKLDIRDLTLRLNRAIGMIVHPKPTQSHGERGKVERAVRTFRRMFSDIESVQKKQSILSWETTFQFMSNSINNLPLARTSKSTGASRGEMDHVLSANRILIGRNNFRSPEGFFDITGDPMKRLEKIQDINKGFFRLLMKNLHEFIPRPKWHVSSEDIRLGDIVLFRQEESKLGDTWSYGEVKEIIEKKKPMKVIVVYKNAGENIFRTTPRNVRELIIIHSVLDLDFNTSEHQLALKAHFSVKNSSQGENL